MSLKLEDVPSNELENYYICYHCLKLFHYSDLSFLSHNQDDPHNILSCCIPCEAIVKISQISQINMNGVERQKYMKEYIGNIKFDTFHIFFFFFGFSDSFSLSDVLFFVSASSAALSECSY